MPSVDEASHDNKLGQGKSIVSSGVQIVTNYICQANRDSFHCHWLHEEDVERHQ